MAAAGGLGQRSGGQVWRAVPAGGESDLRNGIPRSAGEENWRYRRTGTADAEDAAHHVRMASVGDCADWWRNCASYCVGTAQSVA